MTNEEYENRILRTPFSDDLRKHTAEAALPTRNPQAFAPSSAQGRSLSVTSVSTFEITLKDHTVEIVEGADAYRQEGQMTTFFLNGDGRQIVDCWSTRLASFRTTEILIIRRVDRTATPAVHAEGEPETTQHDAPARLRSA